MRVAFLSYQWPGLRMGGIGSYVHQSAAALALAGHEPHVFTVGDPSDVPGNLPLGVALHLTPDPASRVETGQIPAEQAAVVNTGGEAIYRLAIASLLTAEFFREHRLQPFDVVEVADVDASGLPLLLDADRSVPVVVHLHTCTAIANRIHKSQTNRQDQLIEALEAAQIHLADAVCAPTHAVVDATGAQVIKDEVEIIPHPFVCERTEFSPPPIEGPIVFVGRLEWRKGCGVIAAILGEFLAKHPAARLRFVGPDTGTAPGGGSIRQLIEDAVNACEHPDSRGREPRSAVRELTFEKPGLPPPASNEPDRNSRRALLLDRIQFTGELSPAQVAEELAACVFCVMPSLSENFSLAICEAMAAGRTTIVAAETGSVELLGEAAVVVELNSSESLLRAMDELYCDRDRLIELSQSACNRVRTLCDPVTISNRRVEFYHQVISRFNARTTTFVTDRLITLPTGVVATVLPSLARITSAIMRVNEPIDSPGDRLDQICEKLNYGQPTDVILFGAGKHTARLLSERYRWERRGHRVVGLIDDHPRFAQMRVHLGLPVYSLTQAQRDATANKKMPAVVISTDTYEQQFWEQTHKLRQLGVRVVKLYSV